jgi:hypothetical protein
MTVERVWIECDGKIVLGIGNAKGAQPSQPNEIIL